MPHCSAWRNAACTYKPVSEDAVHTKTQTEFGSNCAIYETIADRPTWDHLSVPHLVRGSGSQSCSRIVMAQVAKHVALG